MMSLQEFMVGGLSDPSMSLQVQSGQSRQCSDVPLMMQLGRDVEEGRESMCHNLHPIVDISGHTVYCPLGSLGCRVWETINSHSKCSIGCNPKNWLIK